MKKLVPYPLIPFIHIAPYYPYILIPYILPAYFYTFIP